MSEKKQLTPDEFAAAVRTVAAIQAACQHKNVDEWPFTIEGQRGYMRQCRDCAMFNPPKIRAFEQTAGESK